MMYDVRRIYDGHRARFTMLVTVSKGNKFVEVFLRYKSESMQRNTLGSRMRVGGGTEGTQRVARVRKDDDDADDDDDDNEIERNREIHGIDFKENKAQALVLVSLGDLSS